MIPDHRTTVILNLLSKTQIGYSANSMSKASGYSYGCSARHLDWLCSKEFARSIQLPNHNPSASIYAVAYFITASGRSYLRAITTLEEILR